jgi:CarD family transcriptional regulator
LDEKVFCPYFGVGTVGKIKKMRVSGELRSYYEILLSMPDMKLMIPVGEVKDRGIRKLTTQQKMEQVLKVLTERPPLNDWNSFNQQVRQKIKSSNLTEVAEALRDLLRKKYEKELSWTERVLYKRALNIFASELACVKGITNEEAKEIIIKHFNKVNPPNPH